MQPNPIETLAALRRVLADVVIPNVHDVYARTQVHNALGAIDDLILKLPDEIPWLLESISCLRAILSDAQDAIARLSPDHPLHETARNIAATLDQTGHFQPLQEIPHLRTKVDTLRSELSNLIYALARRGRDLPEAPTLQDRIRHYLRQNIARS